MYSRSPKENLTEHTTIHSSATTWHFREAATSTEVALLRAETATRKQSPSVREPASCYAQLCSQSSRRSGRLPLRSSLSVSLSHTFSPSRDALRRSCDRRRQLAQIFLSEGSVGANNKYTRLEHRSCASTGRAPPARRPGVAHFESDVRYCTKCARTQGKWISWSAMTERYEFLYIRRQHVDII